MGIKQHITYHPDYSIRTYKEYINGELIKEEHYDKKGITRYSKSLNKYGIYITTKYNATGHPIYTGGIIDHYKGKHVPKQYLWKKLKYDKQDRLIYQHNSLGWWERITYSEDGKSRTVEDMNGKFESYNHYQLKTLDLNGNPIYAGWMKINTP